MIANRWGRLGFGSIIALLAFWVLGVSARASEIGYIEDFVGPPSDYVLWRDGVSRAVALCLPVRNGDRIEALTDSGRVTVRLVDRSEPVVLTRAQRDTALTGQAPVKGFWSGLLDWTAASLSPFDSERRQRVSTNIRNDGGSGLAVPLLDRPQKIAAGQRSVTIGWLPAAGITEVRLGGPRGTVLAGGKGVGGLWTSPTLDLTPGRYTLEVRNPAGLIKGALTIVPAARLPALPSDLTRTEIPAPLRNVAQAAWLAAQDGGTYRLESLQGLEPQTNRQRPALVLIDALIAGKTIAPP
jgi:hypothetical protein